ncbi:MAG: hypothetical protein H0V86_10605 [Chloroflexia bacterium]|nr:hypothetical protein [Chloroflexia bacterium]
MRQQSKQDVAEKMHERYEDITFTRCRAYHKNDQAHVEQKNYTQVRQVVGYDRLQGEETLAQLRGIYELLRLYTNRWLPAMKFSRQHRPGTVTHHHGEQDHLAYLERPFLQAREALHRRLHAAGIDH